MRRENQQIRVVRKESLQWVQSSSRLPGGQTSRHFLAVLWGVLSYNWRQHCLNIHLAAGSNLMSAQAISEAHIGIVAQKKMKMGRDLYRWNFKLTPFYTFDIRIIEIAITLELLTRLKFYIAERMKMSSANLGTMILYILSRYIFREIGAHTTNHDDIKCWSRNSRNPAELNRPTQQ